MNVVKKLMCDRHTDAGPWTQGGTDVKVKIVMFKHTAILPAYTTFLGLLHISRVKTTLSNFKVQKTISYVVIA